MPFPPPRDLLEDAMRQVKEFSVWPTFLCVHQGFCSFFIVFEVFPEVFSLVCICFCDFTWQCWVLVVTCKLLVVAYEI